MGWIIYTLASPDGAIRYVGVTTQTMRRRFNSHVYRARKGQDTHKDRWIRTLLSRNQLPVAAVIQTGSGAWQEAECRWIAYYRGLGADLTNTTVGGEGCRGYKHSETIKQNQSLRQKGAVLSLEHKLAISRASKGRKLAPEHRAKLKGRIVSPEVRARMSAAQVGHSVTEKTLQKMSAARKGKPLSEQARRNRPTKLSQAHREAISLGLKKAHRQRRFSRSLSTECQARKDQSASWEQLSLDVGS